MFSDVSCGLKARKFGALERFLSLTDRLAQDPAGLLLDHAGTGFTHACAPGHQSPCVLSTTLGRRLSAGAGHHLFAQFGIQPGGRMHVGIGHASIDVALGLLHDRVRCLGHIGRGFVARQGNGGVALKSTRSTLQPCTPRGPHGARWRAVFQSLVYCHDGFSAAL